MIIIYVMVRWEPSCPEEIVTILRENPREETIFYNYRLFCKLLLYKSDVIL